MESVPSLREQPVPHRLPGAAVRGPLIEATPEAVLLRVPMVGRFLARSDGPVAVERAAGATDADLHCFRDGPVAAAVALLQGRLVLRAACVSIGGRAVALCGASAAGKSAIAAALGQRGHPVIADAVTVMSAEPGEPPLVTPLAPDPVLWPDTARELRLDGPPAARRVRPALDMHAYRLGPRPVTTEVAAVAILRTGATRSEPVVEPLAGMAKLPPLMASRWHGRLVEPLGQLAAQFAILTRLAAVVAGVHLVRPQGGAPLSRLADLVEGVLA
jgi:hypothetical protein